MTPEEQARINIDKQLNRAGWEIVSRNDFVPMNASAVREALMEGNTESDYLLCLDGNAIAVIEAKRTRLETTSNARRKNTRTILKTGTDSGRPV